MALETTRRVFYLDGCGNQGSSVDRLAGGWVFTSSMSTRYTVTLEFLLTSGVVRRHAEAKAARKLADHSRHISRQFLIEERRGKIAILAKDVFQAIGLDKVSIYAKGLLKLIAYPFAGYERLAVAVATNE